MITPKQEFMLQLWIGLELETLKNSALMTCLDPWVNALVNVDKILGSKLEVGTLKIWQPTSENTPLKGLFLSSNARMKSTVFGNIISFTY